MERLKLLSAKNVAIALVLGVLFAASLTDIAYPASSQGAPNGERTPYVEGVVHYDGFVYRDGVVSSEGRSIASEGGVVYEDVMSHPGDLINNVQDSQARFLGTFAVVSLVSFAAATLVTYLHNRSKSIQD